MSIVTGSYESYNDSEECKKSKQQISKEKVKRRRMPPGPLDNRPPPNSLSQDDERNLSAQKRSKKMSNKPYPPLNHIKEKGLMKKLLASPRSRYTHSHSCNYISAQSRKLSPLQSRSDGQSKIQRQYNPFHIYMKLVQRI